MSSRFAVVLLDEDVAVVVAAMLRSRGFDAVTTLEDRRTGSVAAEWLGYIGHMPRKQPLRLLTEGDAALLHALTTPMPPNAPGKRRRRAPK